ncbi:UNVERIFIED_ORG: hypothetical protein E4P37_11725 [Bacillus sp. AZ43]
MASAVPRRLRLRVPARHPRAARRGGGASHPGCGREWPHGGGPLGRRPGRRRRSGRLHRPSGRRCELPVRPDPQPTGPAA